MDTEEAIFAWAIGKALLIVVVSLAILVYAAWAGTRNSGPTRAGSRKS